MLLLLLQASKWSAENVLFPGALPLASAGVGGLATPAVSQTPFPFRAPPCAAGVGGYIDMDACMHALHKFIGII